MARNGWMEDPGSPRGRCSDPGRRPKAAVKVAVPAHTPSSLPPCRGQEEYRIVVEPTFRAATAPENGIRRNESW